MLKLEIQSPRADAITPSGRLRFIRADAITPSGRLRFIQCGDVARLQQEWYCVGGTGADWFDVPITKVDVMPPRREP